MRISKSRLPRRLGRTLWSDPDVVELAGVWIVGLGVRNLEGRRKLPAFLGALSLHPARLANLGARPLLDLLDQAALYLPGVLPPLVLIDVAHVPPQERLSGVGGGPLPVYGAEAWRYSAMPASVSGTIPRTPTTSSLPPACGGCQYLPARHPNFRVYCHILIFAVFTKISYQGIGDTIRTARPHMTSPYPYPYPLLRQL